MTGVEYVLMSKKKGISNEPYASIDEAVKGYDPEKHMNVATIVYNNITIGSIDINRTVAEYDRQLFMAAKEVSL